MKNIYYIKSIYPDYSFNESEKLIHFSEVNMQDRGEERRVVYYSNGIIGVADINRGFNGDEISHGSIFEDDLISELNNPPELVTIEITKKEFEAEWKKAVAQPGFYLKPYSEYTKEDYEKLNR